MKKSKIALYSVLGLILAHPVYATVDCSSGAKPSCDALGYTETTCSSGSYVACPYDKTKKKCIPVAPTCEDLGFTVNDKSIWCTNVVECPSNSEYTLCAAINDCAGYDLDECPEGAVCSACLMINKEKVKVDGCKSGYYDKDGTCTSCLDNPVVTTCPAHSDECYEMSNGYCFINCVSGYKRSGTTCAPNSSGSGSVGNPCFGHTGGYVCAKTDMWYGSENGCANACGSSYACFKCSTGNFVDGIDGDRYDEIKEAL